MQTKLAVSEPGDVHEQEADRVADQVMRMPEGPLQREPLPAGVLPSAARIQRDAASDKATCSKRGPLSGYDNIRNTSRERLRAKGFVFCGPDRDMDPDLWERWVHPVEGVLHFKVKWKDDKPEEPKPDDPPDDRQKRCADPCNDKTDDVASCKKCCEDSIPAEDTKCRSTCNTACSLKLDDGPSDQKAGAGPAGPSQDKAQDGAPEPDGTPDDDVQRKAHDGPARDSSDLNVRAAQRMSGSGGVPLSREVRSFFEPRFGCDFGAVRIHDGPQAAAAADGVRARAFTIGQDVVFAAGEHNPASERGKRLLAHELTHVIQQSGRDTALQREHGADSGFRYTPPKTVTRSIIEIQGIVGATPDAVYGDDTKKAVEKYQTKLKAAGLYTDTVDGKWGDNTETAHVAFATSATTQRRGYNCAGFAFKDFIWHDLGPTKTIYSSMTKLADCSKPCKAFFYKFWLWEVDVSVKNTLTGTVTAPQPDFHTVSGRTDKDGNGPSQVMSKNGQRPVEGPKPPQDWEPKNGPVKSQITGLSVPNFEWIISGTTESCFCSEKLP